MIDNALHSLLTTHAGVATRITPSTETVLVHTDLPRVVYTLIGTTRRYSDSGNSKLTQGRYQLDIFADKGTQARSIADAIRNGLDGYAGTTKETTILRIYFDSESFGKAERIEGVNRTVARFIQDLIIEYREG